MQESGESSTSPLSLQPISQCPIPEPGLHSHQLYCQGLQAEHVWLSLSMSYTSLLSNLLSWDALWHARGIWNSLLGCKPGRRNGMFLTQLEGVMVKIGRAHGAQLTAAGLASMAILVMVVECSADVEHEMWLRITASWMTSTVCLALRLA